MSAPRLTRSAFANSLCGMRIPNPVNTAHA